MISDAIYEIEKANKREQQYVLYALGGTTDNYVPLGYFIFFEQPSLLDLRHQAELMKMKDGRVHHVYAVDNSKRLKKDYEYARKFAIGRVDVGVHFKSDLELFGIKIV